MLCGEQQWQQDQHLHGVFAHSHTCEALAQHTHTRNHSHTAGVIYIFLEFFPFYFGRFSANRKIDSPDICEWWLYTENHFSRILHGRAQSENLSERDGETGCHIETKVTKQPTKRPLENRSARRKVKTTTETSLGKSILQSNDWATSDPIHRRHAQ